MSRLAVMRRVVLDDSTFNTLTRSQQDVMSGSGITRRRRERPAHRASRMLQRLEYELSTGVAVVAWLDTFN